MAHTKTHPGSGNVFADIGVRNPEEALAKANVASSISDIIEARGLTQQDAGKLLGLSQPKVSDLVRGNLGKFTLDRLMRYLRKLDYDVTISIKPKPRARPATLQVKRLQASPKSQSKRRLAATKPRKAASKSKKRIT